ncbi:hypothetical protein PspLS_02311 [Pyricularia sp. CBS 133598]|nr:hypothetical protein PspLS_02311 [Pyricularia sp. CBS 133598]
MTPERIKIINAFGLRPIHIAAIRDQKTRVSMLIKAGTNLNEPTKHGITPLMLSALFGHLEMVCILIKHGAGRSVQDAEQRTAKDYSWSSSNLVRTHWNALEKISEKLQGRCYSADVLRRRKGIRKILRRRDTFKGFLEGAAQPHGTSHFSIAATGEVTLWRKVVSVHNGSGREDTTPAIMARADKSVILQWAFSGWTTGDIGHHVLNSQKYTDLVVAFCRSSGFNLSANARDNPAGRTTDLELIEAEQGRWEACHAEKKLAIFYLRLLMGRTFKNDFKDPLEWDYEFNQEQVQHFKSMKIPNRRKKAYIFLGHDPCAGCLDFLHHLQKVSGISILVKPISIMKEWDRPNKRYGDSATDNQQSFDGEDSDDDDDNDKKDGNDTDSTISNESDTSSSKTPAIGKRVFTRAGSPQLPGFNLSIGIPGARAIKPPSPLPLPSLTCRWARSRLKTVR